LKTDYYLNTFYSFELKKATQKEWAMFFSDQVSHLANDVNVFCFNAYSVCLLIGFEDTEDGKVDRLLKKLIENNKDVSVFVPIDKQNVWIFIVTSFLSEKIVREYWR